MSMCFGRSEITSRTSGLTRNFLQANVFKKKGETSALVGFDIDKLVIYKYSWGTQ